MGRQPGVGPLVSITVVLGLAATSGCGVRRRSVGHTALSGSRTALSKTEATVRVLAQAYLVPAVEAANAAFMDDHPGVSVHVEVADLGQLRQTGHATPSGDVLLAVDGPELEAMRRSAIAPMAPGEPVAGIYAVVAARRGNPPKVKTLEGLRRGSVCRIAIPDLDRDAASRALAGVSKRDHLWDSLRPKLQVCGSHESVCNAVKQGSADVGITYLPLVMSGEYKDLLSMAFFLPKAAGQPASVVALLLAGSEHGLAPAYVDFLKGERGQAAFARSGLEPIREPSASGKSLFVPGGAGLQPAMDHLSDVYRERTGVRVGFSYAGSGVLLAQPDLARRGDLCMPGEAFWVALAEKRGLVDKKQAVVYFVPVIGVPKGNPKHVRTLQDLARPGVRVCIGDPEALAVGPVTQHILERAGILEQVRRNVVMQAGCIPELANAIAMKSADAGIIWDAVAWQHAKQMEAIEISAEQNEAAEVLITTLKVSKQPREAERFMQFVASKEAAAIFREHGFRTERPHGIRLAPQKTPGR